MRSGRPIPWRTALVPRAALAAALSSVLALSACGGSGTREQAPAGEPVVLKIGVIPIVDVAPLFLGMEKGFFKEEKITLKPQFAAGGAAIVPSVQSGEFQIGFSNTVSLLIARSEGLPLRIITQGVQESSDPSGAYSHVYARGDSAIRSPEDLEGKRIAVNTLQNIGDVTIKAALDKRGVDVAQLRFVEAPFPEAPSLLQQKRVDAIWVVEPFGTLAAKDGARPIVANFHETAPRLTVATYFTTDEYLAGNEDVVKRFARAMNRSLEYAAGHPDEVRAILPTYTELPQDLATEVTLPQWSSDLNRPSIQDLSDLSRKYGLIEEQPGLDELIWQGAAG
ncbi:MAG: ABC transporter substrate-binding protein [Streptomycetales bacterium]